MPLIKSGSKAAVSQNISEMEHAGHPHKQAIAAALRTARQYGRASGGVTPPMGERMAARQMFHEGFLHSAVPGRTDKLPISVAGGAYVLPADHVAALGQGNSIAGADIVNKKFKMGPYGASASPQHAIHGSAPKLNLTPKVPKMTLKGGGIEGHGKPTDIIAAGGEMTIPPGKIIDKYGSLRRGHQELNRWVVGTRAKHIKTLKKLKPPKDD